MPRPRPLVALALAAGIGGCVPAERFEEERQRALCEVYVECGDYPDVDLCLALRFPAGPDPYLAAAVEAGRVEYDAGQGRRCIAAIADQQCTYRADWDRIDELCAAAFVGTVPPEGECLDTRDCAGDAVCGFDPTCLADDACCPGRCRFLGDRAEIGESCSDRACVDGALCRVDAGDGDATCVAAPWIGESCEGLFTCADGAYCGPDQTCVGLKGEGAACDYDDQCAAPGYCVQGPDEELRRCRHPARRGEPCDPEQYGRACLRADHVCDRDEARCRRRGEPGDRCESDDECLDYARCVDDFCVEFRRVGEACTYVDGINCYPGLSCDGERCTEPDVPAWELCTL